VIVLAVIGLIGVLEAARLLLSPQPIDLLVLGLVVAAGVGLLLKRDEAAGPEGTRRTEAESFARILRGLARSVSPDAIVNAIAEELGTGTGADHVVVVRRRPETRNLEAILSSPRIGAPASRTYLPLSVLEDPAEDAALSDLAIAVSRGRRMTAVRIEPDPGGDPQMVPLGIAMERRGVSDSGGLALDTHRGSVAVATMQAPPRRAGHAAPSREGADQRIADRIAGRVGDLYGLQNLAAAALRVDGKVEGAIVLSRRTGSWPDSSRRILEASAVEASAALARVYSLRDAEARATTDALTGLPNRRYFDEYVGLLARRRRAEDRVGVLMIDIDWFKKLNDTFGHGVGDHVLREVAQAIAGAVREGDVPARFGGEEFAVLLRNPGPDVAVEVGERVRRAVSGLDLRRMGVPGVSVSVGVAVAESQEMALEVVIDEADRALYRAKRAGRNRVVAA
jgi:diguanylate cyclase (GGDEF)-like protein